MCQLLLNYVSSRLFMETLSPQATAQQGQSSSSPHPVSILSQPASGTFHGTPRTLLGLSRSRSTSYSASPSSSLAGIIQSCIFIPPPSLLSPLCPRLLQALNMAQAPSTRPHWPLLDKRPQICCSLSELAGSDWQMPRAGGPHMKQCSPEIPAPAASADRRQHCSFFFCDGIPSEKGLGKAPRSAHPPWEGYFEASLDVIRK